MELLLLMNRVRLMDNFLNVLSHIVAGVTDHLYQIATKKMNLSRSPVVVEAEDPDQ